jgi:hypothetical protein
MNTPVNYKLAKLLEKKGFDEPCKLCVEEGDEMPLPFNCGDTIHRNSLHPYYSAPTIAEVVMWIYDKYGIWIYAERYSTLFRCYAEEIGDERFGKWEGHKYESPTEAYLAAIEYTLNKLI